MPLYNYKGYDIKTGDRRKGTVEAESLKAARQKLKQKDRIITSSLKEQASSQGKGINFSIGGGRVKLEDVASMTRQFATLMQAHVPLDESLKALEQQVDQQKLRETLVNVKEMVSEGKSLGEAVSKHPLVFNKLYLNMVNAGEASGTLGLVLERLSEFQEYQIKVRGQIFGALSYPLLMILAALGIIAYLFVSVVPKLQKVFKSLKVELPGFTQALIAISEFVQNQWYIVIIVIGVGVFIFKQWVSKDKGKLIFDKWLLGLPLFGPLIMRINVSKFTKTLATLLNSGVPIIKALDITANIVGNKVLSDVIESSKVSVQEGNSLGVTIEKSQAFPPLVSHMIKTGEKTGDMEKMLMHLSDAYDQEVERKINSMISLIEPLMIIVLGLIVVVVVAGMMVPMLSVMNQMR